MAEDILLTAKQTAEKLDVSPARVRDLCQRGRVRGAKKLGMAWMIPDPPVLLGKMGNLGGSDYVTAPEAARIMGISRQRLSDLCTEGKIKGAIQKGRYWSIPFPIERLQGRNGRPPRDEAPTTTP